MSHLDTDLMAAWHNTHHDELGIGGPALEAYQVRVLDPLPDGDRLPDLRLDSPGLVLGE